MSRTHALRLFQRYQGLIGLGLLFIVAAALKPHLFFSGDNFVNILKQLAVPGTLAVGMTFVILTGGIDLSVGSLLGLGNVILAEWAGTNTGLTASIAYVLAVATGIGLLVGWVIGASRLQPFIVTLAAMVTLRGICYLYTNNAIVSVDETRLQFVSSPVAGLPISAWVLILVTLGAAILLAVTVFGRHIYALGGNEFAAKLSGVNVKRVRMAAFALNGLCVGIAAVLFTARTNSGQPSAGIGYELDAIAAVVVGGSSLVGGIGNIFGTFVGAFFMACVNNLLQLNNVDSNVALGWKGLIVLLAVYLQNIGR